MAFPTPDELRKNNKNIEDAMVNKFMDELGNKLREVSKFHEFYVLQEVDFPIGLKKRILEELTARGLKISTNPAAFGQPVESYTITWDK